MQSAQNWGTGREFRSLGVAVVLLLMFGTWPSHAFANPTRDGWGFGIADDSSADVITGSGFRQLGTKVFRFQVHYDADSTEKTIAHAKITAAQNAGVQSIMVTFTHGASDPDYVPSVDQWAAGVISFVAEFDPLVDMWGVANEPNHKWLAGVDGACLLAGYYHALYDELARRGWVDRLVSPEWHDDYAADGTLKTTLDESGHTVSTVVNYIHHYLGCQGGWGHIIGWHPYGGVARESRLSTDDFLNNTPSGMPVMLTEVGSTIYNSATGIFLTEGQQEHQVRWLVDTLANHPRISRVYYYHQRQPSGSLAWDSGLERCSGFLRPSWYTYCSAIHNGQCNPATVPPPGPCPGAYVPPDGGFWRTPDGSVYRIAGGSPIHLFTCAPQGYFPGCSNIFNLPETLLIEWTAQQPFPRDGTFLLHPNGAVFRVVGGALVYLSTCTAQGYFPGCSNLIALDGIAINGLINAQALPRNGALVRAPDGSVYRMECGDATYVSDCANVGGCSGLVDLPFEAVNPLVAATGCDDGKLCTTDRCDNLVECRHEFAAQCLAPILSLLEDDDCGNGVTDPGEECDDGNTVSGDGCSASCRVESHTPSARNKLLIKDAPDPRRRQLLFEATDPRIDTTVGVGMNPVADGASLHVYNNRTGDSACLTFPAAGWRVKGSPPNVSYSYRDTHYFNGPCGTASIGKGKIKLKCKAKTQSIDYTLDEPEQQSIGVNFTSGAHTLCALFGGTITSDSGTDPPISGGGGRFAAQNAPPPDSCPTAPAACP